MKQNKSIVTVLVILLFLTGGCANSATPTSAPLSQIPQNQPEEQPNAQLENQPEIQPEGQPEEQPNVQPENQPEIQPEGQSEEFRRNGELTITFDFQRQSGHASNQFAVWIQDSNGAYVKTLYATRFTAKGGYKIRPDSIPLWAENSDLSNMSDTQIDAITGATPQSGTLEYVWDLTDESGNPVPIGKYIFFAEGSLRWKNRVLYSGEITIDNEAITVTADRKFFYEESTDQPALSDNSTEHGMIGAVTARYVPI